MSEEPRYEEEAPRQPVAAESEAGFPSLDAETIKFLIGAGDDARSIISRFQFIFERLMATGNIDVKEIALLQDKLKNAVDCLDLQLKERAEKILADIFAALSLSKSLEGWQQRLLRTKYSSTENVTIQPEPKRRGILSFFGGE